MLNRRDFIKAAAAVPLLSSIDMPTTNKEVTFRTLTPACFAMHASKGQWHLAPHLELIDKALLEAAMVGNKRILISAPPRHGKALAIDTPIPTPSGWKKIGDLEPGDMVFGDDGVPCRVVAVSEVFENRPVYSVQTDCGDEVIADAEHDWLVRLDRSRPNKKIYSTKYLAGRSSPRAPMIDCAAALHLPEADLPIDPYVFGVWLGDGSSRGSQITTADEEIHANVEAAVGASGKQSRGGNAWNFRAGGSFREGTPKNETIQAQLRAMGCILNKHIPDRYKRASAKQRRRLLQGIVDTDGYVAPDGQVEVCTTSQRLAFDYRELVASLGHKASIILGRATVRGKDCGPKYRVMFYMAGAASIERKASRCRHGERAFRRYVRVRPAGFANTRCIQVDSPSHLFLCGLSMLPTHNSMLCSHYFPPWYLGMFPDNRIIMCSYEADFAASWGRKAREVIDAHGHNFDGGDGRGIAVSGHSAAANRWDIAHHLGGMQTAGVGGPITGKGADILLIDDYIKNAEDASSEVIRAKTWDWWRSTAVTRLEPNASVIIIATRWHEDDLIGRLIEDGNSGGEKWDQIVIPAICESENDLLGRPIGAALWPERYDEVALDKIRRTVGAYFWAAMYQGRPAPLEGGLFKRGHFKIVDKGPNPRDVIARVRFWDFGGVVDGDYTVGVKMAQTADGRFWIEHVVRWRPRDNDSAIGVRDRIIQQTAQLDGPACLVGFEQEPGSGGLSQVKYVATKIQGWPITIVKPTGDPILRAMPLAAAGDDGQIMMVNGPWCTDFVDECIVFPNGSHDDQVMAASYAFSRLANSGVYSLDVPRGIKRKPTDPSRWGIRLSRRENEAR